MRKVTCPECTGSISLPELRFTSEELDRHSASQSAEANCHYCQSLYRYEIYRQLCDACRGSGTTTERREDIGLHYYRDLGIMGFKSFNGREEVACRSCDGLAVHAGDSLNLITRSPEAVIIAAREQLRELRRKYEVRSLSNKFHILQIALPRATKGEQRVLRRKTRLLRSRIALLKQVKA